MKPTIVQPKVEAPTVPATNGSPTKTTSTSTTDQGTKEVALKSRINSIWDSGWDILSKAATAIVIIWGGQGIYDRNFNQKDESTLEIRNIDEVKNLEKRIHDLENETNKTRNK